MALTKVTTKGITDNAVDGDKLAPGSVTTAKIGPSAVESSEIGDGTVTASDLASTLDLSPKTVTLAGSTVESLKRPVQDNIALLGFKMAVNDGLTVFNLVDGIVDEFHDESGTDESEGSNDQYCATSDFYQNITLTPAGTGVLDLDGLLWPSSDGTANYVLKTDGSAQLSWTEMSSGLGNIVEDTSPQLGAALDTAGYNITSTSNQHISIVPHGTGDVKLEADNIKIGDSDADVTINGDRSR